VRFIELNTLPLALWLLSLCPLQSRELQNTSIRFHNGEGISMPLFSSLTSTRFARIEIQRMSPARLGIAGSSLALGIPGYRIAGLQVSLFPVPCSAEDWEQLLAALRPLKSGGVSLRGGIRLTLPDGRVIVGPNALHVQGTTLLLDEPRARKAQPQVLVVDRDATGKPRVSPLLPPPTHAFPTYENKTNP
jgi:hypothetical protein